MRRIGLMMIGVVWVLGACSSEPTTTTSSSSSGSSSASSTTSTGSMGGATSSSSTTSSTTGTGGAGGATTSSSATGTGGGDGGATKGHCSKTCAVAKDCCANPNDPNCPGKFPKNPTCEGGICKSPQCSSKDDCAIEGPEFDCLTLSSGIKGCTVACMSDAECPGTSKCTGMGAMGKYCQADVQQSLCMADADCNGFGKCDVGTGACYCDSSSDCTNPTLKDCVFK